MKDIELNYDQPQTRWFEILSYTIQELQRRADLTLWVPDWSCFPRFPLGHRIAYNMAPVTGRYGYVEVCFLRTSEGILEVFGVLSGTVHQIITPPLQDKNEALATIRDWAPNKYTYPTGEKADDAFAWTLVQGQVNERYGYFPVSPGFVISFQEQKEAIYREVRHRERLPDDGDRLQEVIYKIHDRGFFMTPNGHFRLAPGATKEGDLIFTILSCDELIVPRPLLSDIY